MDSHLFEPSAGIIHHQIRPLSPPERGWNLLARRPLRVMVLSLAIAAMSGADLYLTLLYVTHTGMNEMNPLARAMMEYQSPAVLALWKTGTVVLCVGILLMIRRKRSAEIGAWAGCLLLGWLMTHWAVYIELTRDMDLELARAAGQHDPTWIMMETIPHRSPGPPAWPGRTVID